MKRMFAIVLACTLLLGALPLVAVAEEGTVTNSLVADWEGLKTEAEGTAPGKIPRDLVEKIRIPSLKAREMTVYESEPNDTLENADEVGNDDTVVGTLGLYDVDRYRFVLTEESAVVIGAASELSKLYAGIWNANDEIVGLALPYENENGLYTYSMVEYFPAGTYYLTVIDGDNVGKDYLYAVALSWIPHTHEYSVQEVVAPSCTEDGYTIMACRCGDTYNEDPVSAHGHTYTDDKDTVCDVCAAVRVLSVPMHRMYDPNSGEHFYTGSEVERDFLVTAGWHYEGVGFNFPEEGSPVYRLYDPVWGEHLYTMDLAEVAKLTSESWNNEGVAFNSAETDEVPQYRLHNPNAKRGGYHFTGSIEERDFLISIGWINEGIGWYSCLE